MQLTKSSDTLLHRPDSRRASLAVLGAMLGIVAWMAVGALTGLGKFHSLVIPLAPLMGIAGALLALSRFRLVLWLVASAAIATLLLVALTPLTTSVLSMRPLVRRDAPLFRPLDGVIVLSGGITADSLLEPEALDRLLTGLALMRDSAAPLLVVTRPRREDDGAVADRDQEGVRALVPRPFPMAFVDSVRTTHDEAVKAWQLFQQRGVASPHVAVVTSPLHTRRACATFEQVGFVVACVPATSRAYSVAHAGSAPERVALFRRWLYERAAWSVYRSKGWVRKD